MVADLQDQGHHGRVVRRRLAEEDRRPAVVLALMVLAAGFGVFVAAGWPEGGKGVFLVLAGGIMVFARPYRAIPWYWWLLGIVVVLASCLALLPSSWLGEESWRVGMRENGLIPLAGSVTPVPRETLFWIGILACTVWMGLYTLSQPSGPRGMYWLAVLVSGICASYAGAALWSSAVGWKTPFHGSDVFGFLPNRNHTATLLVVGILVATGGVTFGFREKKYVTAGFMALALAVCAWALLLASPSRAGVIFLMAGLLLYFGGLGSSHLSRPVAVSIVALVLVAAVFLFGTENPLRDRLEDTADRVLQAPGQDIVEGRTGEVGWDFRAMIFRDAVRMAVDRPLTGTGLGSFAYLFPFYVRASLTDNRAVHPESDWLMALIEVGPVAVLSLLALVVAVLLGLRGGRQMVHWPLRWGFVCAGLAAALHGLIDVPFHRVELGWLIILVAGIGLGRRNPALETGFQRWLFAAGGVGALVMGGWLVRAQLTGGPPTPPFAALEAQRRVDLLYREGLVWESLQTAQASAWTMPWSRGLHFLHGVLELNFEGGKEAADRAFARERILEPNWPRVPFEQARIWMEIDEARAAEGLQEAVRRQVKLGEATGRLLAGEQVYAEALRLAHGRNSLLQRMRPGPSAPEGFLFMWIQSVPVGSVPFTAIALEEGRSFSEDGRGTFLKLWFERGDRNELWEFLDSSSEWEKAGWAVRIQDLAARGRWQEAVDKLASRFRLDLSIPTPGREVMAGTGEGRADLPEEEFLRLWRSGNTVAAERELAEAMARRPGPEILRLRAAVSVYQMNWEQAYKEAVAWVRAVKPEEGRLL